MSIQNDMAQKILVHPNEKILGRILLTFGAFDLWGIDLDRGHFGNRRG
ncbi:MAG: hypothetical protein JNL76_08335 [Alphaproteobacteria bacterium]|nr:hypothetical protein [Alphaproteobacteria bacterium]